MYIVIELQIYFLKEIWSVGLFVTGSSNTLV